ncbi:MAG TPA: ribonuclease activity regulator RraA [Dehalococcoidia bacterium]|nr:ribonuclease activity regulator RraA [Dehalococcoidia bacterium]
MTDALPALPASLWEDLEVATTATLNTVLTRNGLRSTAMRGVFPLQPGMRLAAEATTLRYVPMREDIRDPAILANSEYPQRKIVENIPAGRVLVVDARGDTGAGILGDILITRMRVRGAKGVVTDGAMRDAAGVRALGWPVFAAAAHPAQHIERHFAVGIDEVIGCGGVMVRPGDLIVGDDDGVVVLPRAVAAEIARAAREQDELESFVQRTIAGGASIVGVYPPNEATRAAFEAWRRRH